MKLHLKPAHIVWLRILEQRISALDTRHGSGQNPSQLSWPRAFDSDFTCQLKQVVGPSCILWQVVRQVGCQLNQYLSPFRSARNFSTSVSQYQQRYQEPTRPKQNPKQGAGTISTPTVPKQGAGSIRLCQTAQCNPESVNSAPRQAKQGRLTK